MEKLSIRQSLFGSIDGEDVFLFVLSNGVLDISIMNYGCTIVSVHTPDRLGHKRNIVAGFDKLEDYQRDHPHIGCVVGRFANRISYARFVLDGQEHQLSVNEPPNHLHGGFKAFHRQVWHFEKIIDSESGVGVCFTYFSKDGEEGYPGNLETTVTYLLTSENKLLINYSATTDQPTIVNLTNHSYFNLTGFQMPEILAHRLQIFANSYTVKNGINTSSGITAPVQHTPMDFSLPKMIGEDIGSMTTDEGYEYNYVLDKSPDELVLAATLHEHVSGRMLNVFTDAPGIQLYTSNWFDGALTGSQGVPYRKHAAVALETQAIPDAPNHPQFPSAVLRPGEVYNTKTIYQFLTV